MDHNLLCFLWLSNGILEASTMYRKIYLFFYSPEKSLGNLTNHLKTGKFLLKEYPIIFLRVQMASVLYLLSKN